MKTKRNDLTPTKGGLIRGRKLNFGDDEPTPVKEKPKPKTKTINLPKEIRDEFYNPKLHKPPATCGSLRTNRSL